MKKILLITIWLLMAAAAFAQSNTDKVRQFERLMREWKSAAYSTGSEKYTQLKSMVTEGCKMSERVAKAYIDEYNASTFDIRVNSWFQYIKENQISISLRDLREETGNDGRRIVYCWVKYTQPGRQDKEDFVGFKFDGGKIFYICNDDMERANRIKADKDDMYSAPFTITSCAVRNWSRDAKTEYTPFDSRNTRILWAWVNFSVQRAGSYEILCKLITPTTTFSERKTVELPSGNKGLYLYGCGTDVPGNHTAGNYRYEFYYNGTLLYTYRFSVPEGQSQDHKSDLDYLSASKLYDKGREYLDAEDYKNAIPYLRRAAERGNAGAQVDLGWCYSTGNGVTENKNEAVKWYKKSAEQGNATAQANLGWMYVFSDDNEAAKWFKKAADQGYVNSVDIYNQLAYYAAQGRGLPKSFEQAHKYIDKAISLDPNEWNYYDSKGEIYLMEGNISKAREYYNKCVRMYSNYSSQKSELWKYFNK